MTDTTNLLAHPPVDPYAKVFDRSAALERIRDYARAKRLPPMGLLAAVLAHVAASLPPSTTLDIGKGPGSLNIFFALCGPSGANKSSVISRAGEPVTIAGGGRYVTKTPGTGEGIVATYAGQPAPAGTKKKKDKPPAGIPRETSVLWEESEVTNLEAMTSRQGATLAGFMLKMWSAETLNITTKTVQLPAVPAFSYRAALLLGVQPAKAGVLTTAQDNGTLQRYVWVPMNDPGRIKGHNYPEVQPLHLNVGKYAGKTIQGCKTAFTASLAHDDRALIDGDTGGASAHGIYQQAKLATLLAVLRSHDSMQEDDWQRAGAIMEISDAVRGEAEEHLKQKKVAALVDAEEQKEEAATERRERLERKRDKLAVQFLEAVDVEDGAPALQYSPFAQSLNGQRRRVLNSIRSELLDGEAIRVYQLENGAEFVERGPRFRDAFSHFSKKFGPTRSYPNNYR